MAETITLTVDPENIEAMADALAAHCPDVIGSLAERLYALRNAQALSSFKERFAAIKGVQVELTTEYDDQGSYFQCRDGYTITLADGFAIRLPDTDSSVDGYLTDDETVRLAEVLGLDSCDTDSDAWQEAIKRLYEALDPLPDHGCH
jgi:hypothetical protein